MIQRWICETQGYSFSVKHRQGFMNANANALSRCPITPGLEDNENCMISWEIATLDIEDISQRQ